jgi:curved DNA-binding protein CbpA
MAGAEAAGSPYEVLGVTPGASPQAIVHAYRRLARSSHTRCSARRPRGGSSVSDPGRCV